MYTYLSVHFIIFINRYCLMSNNKVEEDFDCLEFKQKAQEEAYENIKNLTPEKQIKYYRTIAESSSLGDWWKKVKNKSSNIE